MPPKRSGPGLPLFTGVPRHIHMVVHSQTGTGQGGWAVCTGADRLILRERRRTPIHRQSGHPKTQARPTARPNQPPTPTKQTHQKPKAPPFSTLKGGADVRSTSGREAALTNEAPQAVCKDSLRYPKTPPFSTLKGGADARSASGREAALTGGEGPAQPATSNCPIRTV